jgi:acylphosphatase
MAMNSGRRIVRVSISGRVQGVGFRAWAEYGAIARGLEGWVRNRRDGSVEAVFAGPAERVGVMVAACRRGPSAARVDNVDEVEADLSVLDLRRDGEGFSVLPTTE